MPELNNSQTKTNFIIAIGAALEYYDYIIFALLAKYITLAFIPSLYNSMTANFLFFSLGNVIRLFGGIFFGYIGDKYSRKNTVMSLSLVMGIATLCIGFLPLNMGITLNICLLFTLRSFQALSFGGEIPGAVSYLYEVNSNKNIQGVSIGFVFSGASIGFICATTILSLLTLYFTQENMLSWGWRIPILLGGGLSIMLWSFRKKIINHEQTKNTNIQDISNLILKNKIPIFLLSLMLAFPACFITMNIYLGKYLTNTMNVASSSIYIAQTIGMFFALLISPICGIFSARYYNKKYIMIFLYLSFILVGLFFSNIVWSNVYHLSGLTIIWQIYNCIGLTMTLYLAMKMINAKIRFSSLAIIYNLGITIGSFAPMIISNTFLNNQGIYALFYAPLIFAGIAVLCNLILLKYYK